MSKKDEQRIVIVHSVAPYEDAKSAVKTAIGWGIFIVIALLIVAALVLYAILYTVYVVLYTVTWLWWYPWVNAAKILDSMPFGKALPLCLLGSVLGVIVGLLVISAVENKNDPKWLSAIKFVTVYFLPALWIWYLIVYAGSS